MDGLLDLEREGPTQPKMPIAQAIARELRHRAIDREGLDTNLTDEPPGEPYFADRPPTDPLESAEPDYAYRADPLPVQPPPTPYDDLPDPPESEPNYAEECAADDPDAMPPGWTGPVLPF